MKWLSSNKSGWKIHQLILKSELDSFSFHLILCKNFEYHRKCDLLLVSNSGFVPPRKSRTWHLKQITFSMTILFVRILRQSITLYMLFVFIYKSYSWWHDYHLTNIYRKQIIVTVIFNKNKIRTWHMTTPHFISFSVRTSTTTGSVIWYY